MIKAAMKTSRARTALFAAAGILAAAVTAAALPRPREGGGAAGAENVVLQSNERELYPRLEDVAVRSIERLPDGVGAVLSLESDKSGFSHFEYSTNGEPFRKADGGRLVIAFKRSPDIQRTETIIRAVGADGGVSKDRFININYYPREHYAKAGQTAPGFVILQKTDIPFAQSRVADWIADRPTADDVGFATVKWGAKVKAAAGPLEKARRLAMLLLDDL
ncbi:MAG TPA: hypothetical protein PLX50_08035, partial [Candidatus Aminicenantes bacterium]|nr:hypothetical protein [Candidatus Aminicenantes bacterium]